MSRFSRRIFLQQASAVALCTMTEGVSNAAFVEDQLRKEATDSILPASFPGMWAAFGRLALQGVGESVILQDGFAMSNESWKDGEFSFRSRAPKETEEVQIWAGVRCHDRERRYVFGLRGGDNDDLYLARYAPDGGIKFLGLAPLDFHPVPEVWYKLRAVVRSNRFLLYLNDELLPRINAVDDDALWSEGRMSLGGGWLPAEFCDVHVRPLVPTEMASLDAIGNQVWSRQSESIDRRRLRARQRAAYRVARVDSFSKPRTEISLDGKWLFLPDQERRLDTVPHASDCDDTTWHLMDVPSFWKPSVTWLYGETGFPYLDNASAMKGVSDRFYLEEVRRLDGCTFDWRLTRSAWYRHYVDLPADIAERRFELCFDAIAKVSEVWVNGVKIASHTGMFGEVRQDVTSAMTPGRNVIAVHAIGEIDEANVPDKVLGLSVTVEVTASMLNSLPHGMYHDVGGIWQPVRLIVTGPVRVGDVSIQPSLDGVDFSLTVEGSASNLQQGVFVSFSIRSVEDGILLYSSSQEKFRQIEPRSSQHFIVGGLKPEPWSPQNPKLYDLEIRLTSEGKVLDQHSTRFGFRVFTAANGRLLLNGEPLWLRGANHFPHALRPNDRSLARRFMKLAKEGNVIATRTHTAPFSRTWLEAADEAGMLVSFEGTWPWLMLRGEPPSADLINQWRTEFLSLVRKYRNHPSIVIWTVNNEMKFASSDEKNTAQLRQKWEILTTAIKAIRAVDPSRPVVCDSSYCRKDVENEYDTLIQPCGFDDGDIDDAHLYPGWYSPSFFHYLRGEFGARSYPGRPLISQEMSTGYPRNDDGHPARFYLFKHYTPQSLVGDEAYDNRDSGIFLKRQAFLTKELAEAIRRTNRSDCSGILHFAYLTWFKDAWDSESIRPYETYYALRLALQPLLVSAELYGRHFYAGSNLATRVCIVNDGAALPATELRWQINAHGATVAAGLVDVPQVPYYSDKWVDLSIAIPGALRSPRVDAKLQMFLKANGVLYSENSYDVVIATSAWASKGEWPGATLIDPKNRIARPIQEPNIRLGSSLRDLKPSDPAIIVDAEEILRTSEDAKLLKKFVADGGRVLLLGAGEQLVKLFPELVKGFRSHACEIVTMRIPESLAFDGLGPLDLAWWELGGGAIPQACRGTYQIHSERDDIQALADAIDFHGYLNGSEDFAKVSGSPLVEIRLGKGRILASEMMILEASQFDPIARKLFTNLIQMLSTGASTAPYAAIRATL